MDSDEEDFVFFGTPIEREEEITSRKKKAVAEASGNLRSLAPWKQEVTDEEGRRRFHGAFTGGFSAGYYNTVGSKEGWAPQSFTSSRKNRAEVKQQNILNFLDEDEKVELDGRSLGTSSQFDTFGFTASELARKQAEKEQEKRPSAIPGPIPNELVVPVAESIGVKLLLKMGWRHGRSIKNSRANSLYDARREARKALLAFSSDDAKTHISDFESTEGDLENLTELNNDVVQSSQSTPVYVQNPKQDLHGLGYDPYKHAPEFREKKRSSISGNREPGYRKVLSMKESLFGFKSGKVAPGFGIGALEELDAEDEDVYASGYDFEETYVQEVEEPSTLSTDGKLKLTGKEQGVLPGFRAASISEYRLERFDPPVIPKDFVPCHKFSGPLDTGNNLSDPPPLEVSPPEDNNLRLLIDGVATLVARCGKLFEDLSKEKNQSNPLFSFLTGGSGHDYYARKLWEERQKRNDQTKKHVDWKLSPSVQKMTAESRGKILGERPLERSVKDSSTSNTSADVHLQFNLSDTFTQPASSSQMLEVAKPFKDDPAKQERFEQFIKEKYYGGLRSTDPGGAGHMSEAARARERLDFEAAAEATEKGKWGKESKLSMQHFMEFPAAGGMQFTSGGLEKMKDTLADETRKKKMYPRREEYQWRPSNTLCKRFDLIDPYLGKPPPAPRMKSKIDSFVFMSDVVKATKVEENVAADRDPFTTPHTAEQEIGKDVIDMETKVGGEMENLERPVDLYKAIFSDDSDDEVDTTTLNRVEDPEKKIEVANTTLNRLIAGDFLESLGKELGLEVPPDVPNVTNKFKTHPSQKEIVNVNAGDASTLPVSRTHTSTANAVNGDPLDQGVPHHREIHQEGKLLKHELSQGSLSRSGRKYSEDMSRKDAKNKTPSRDRHQSNSSSSEDGRSRKRSRHYRSRISDTDSDSSSDHRERYHSRSKGKKKGSSSEKSRSSKRHSKQRRHGSISSSKKQERKSRD